MERFQCYCLCLLEGQAVPKTKGNAIRPLTTYSPARKRYLRNSACNTATVLNCRMVMGEVIWKLLHIKLNGMEGIGQENERIWRVSPETKNWGLQRNSDQSSPSKEPYHRNGFQNQLDDEYSACRELITLAMSDWMRLEHHRRNLITWRYRFIPLGNWSMQPTICALLYRSVTRNWSFAAQMKTNMQAK